MDQGDGLQTVSSKVDRGILSARYPLWMVPIVSPVDKLQFEVVFVVEGVHVVHLEDVEVMEVSREID